MIIFWYAVGYIPTGVFIYWFMGRRYTKRYMRMMDEVDAKYGIKKAGQP